MAHALYLIFQDRQNWLRFSFFKSCDQTLEIFSSILLFAFTEQVFMARNMLKISKDVLSGD